MFPSSNKTLTFLPKYEDPEVFLGFFDFTVAKEKNAIQRNVKRGQTGSKQPCLYTKHFNYTHLVYYAIRRFLCVHSHFLIAFCVFTGVPSNSLSESLNRGFFLDRSIPKFEFLSGGPCLAVLSNGYVFFCRLTRPRLVLLGNIVSTFLEAAICRSATALSIR